MRAFIVRGEDESAYQLASADGGLVLTTGAEADLVEWAAKRHIEVGEASAGDISKPSRFLTGVCNSWNDGHYRGDRAGYDVPRNAGRGARASVAADRRADWDTRRHRHFLLHAGGQVKMRNLEPRAKEGARGRWWANWGWPDASPDGWYAAAKLGRSFTPPKA